MSQLEFRGIHAEILHDATAEIDVEGGLSTGKTTLCLWKELEALRRYPGIWMLLSRWTGDAVTRLLRPAFEQLQRIHANTDTDAGPAGHETWDWKRDENYYEMSNGSRAFAFGLQTQSQDPEQRYGKIRGLPVSRIYIDQAEQVPADIASELRARLRPDIEARLKGIDYPRQLTFSPNPVNDSHWLCKQFPEKNTIKGRRYYSLSMFDNRHNLPDDMIESMLREYPEEHPKHQTVILGKRGLNVIGDPIYEQIFNRTIHVKATDINLGLPLIEAFEVGQHNPTWVIAQRSHYGGLTFLGGVMGKRMILDDFLPLVKRTRQDWFQDHPVKTCTGPMGDASTNAGNRYTLITMLRESGLRPVCRANANAADVQLAMIEQVGGLLRRRVNATDEAISINASPDRWIVVAPDGAHKPVPFLSFAFEGGYVWSPHTVSVSDKELRQPYSDDEYFNAMRCVEHLVLNFCSGQKSDEEKERARAKAKVSGIEDPAPSNPHSWMGS